MLRQSQVNTSLMFGILTWGTCLNRRRIGERWGKYGQLNIPSYRCGLLGLLSVLVLRDSIELIMLSLERNSLALMRWLLLLQGASSLLQVLVLIYGVVCPAKLCCSFGPFLFPCHKDIINQSWTLDPKVTAKWMTYSKEKYKMDAEMPRFSLTLS